MSRDVPTPPVPRLYYLDHDEFKFTGEERPWWRRILDGLDPRRR